MLCHGDDGFTLVEVLTVVLILAILTSIAVASFVSSSSLSEKVACKSNQRILGEGVMQYRVSNSDTEPDELVDVAPYVRSYEKASRCPADGRALEFDASECSVYCTYPGHD